MRYNSTINNVKANEWGLTIQQAYLFSWFYELPSWANKVMIENEIYYFASKNKAIEELPILTEKPDTMYRFYKQLECLDLVIIRKIDGKDYVALTTKAKEWNLSKSDYSENNPSIVGLFSENYSENNPTYNNTINNNKNKEKTKTSLFVDCIYSDYETLKNILIKDTDFVKKYKGVDLKAYIFKVDSWSESSQTKRTERGWLMTLRKFMSDALESNSLVKIEAQKKPNQGHINY